MTMHVVTLVTAVLAMVAVAGTLELVAATIATIPAVCQSCCVRYGVYKKFQSLSGQKKTRPGEPGRG